MSPDEFIRFQIECCGPEVPLRSTSFLGEMGYTTSLPLSERREILASAVDKYGKSSAVTQIKFNIRMRESQKNASKYAHAIGIWKTDIEYVNTLIDTFKIREEEEAKKRKQQVLEEIRKQQELETQEFKLQKPSEPKREWAWWEHENVKILE